MRILLTGSSGFVAGAFLGRYHDTFRATCLGRRAHPFASTAISCDLADTGGLERALKTLEREPRFDAIVHLATSRLHRDFPRAAADLFSVNTAATASLLDFARRTGVPHFCLGSTGSVYDTPIGHRMAESDITPPKSFFVATKLAADMFAACYRPLMAVSILRFFVPYGPGLDDRMLTSIVKAVRARQAIKVPSKGAPLTFAPIYGDDVATVVACCLNEVWNETVNVAGEEVVTVVDAARTMGAILGIDVETEPDPAAGAHYLVPDLSRLRARVDTRSFIPFRLGIERMISDNSSSL